MNKVSKTLLGLAAAGALAVATAVPASAYVGDSAVPGFQNRDGGTVTGHYTLEDYAGCDYVVNYRGDFGDEPFLDDGWVMNQIRCDDGTNYSYLIVHETDPRFTGNPDNLTWGGTWEIISYVVSGEGQQVNPHLPSLDAEG